MKTHSDSIFEIHLKEIAYQFRYPATPDVAGTVMRRLRNGSGPLALRRAAWSVGSLLILTLAVLFAVPGVRAEIIRFFQSGAVRIFPMNDVQTVTASPESALLTTSTPDPFSTQTKLEFEPPYLVTITDLAGETTLSDANAVVPFPIRQPAYPADLGPPDRVFVQEGGQLVVLVWTAPDDQDVVRLSLHEIGPDGILIEKYEPQVIQETQVRGNYALWVEGPYLIRLTNGTYNFRRLVAGNTLIWEAEDITYRIETDMTLEETLKIAESLR